MQTRLTDEQDREVYHVADRAASVLTPIFRAFGWEWAKGGELFVPTHTEMRAHVSDLCRTLLLNDNGRAFAVRAFAGRVLVYRDGSNKLVVALHIDESYPECLVQADQEYPATIQLTAAA